MSKVKLLFYPGIYLFSVMSIVANILLLAIPLFTLQIFDRVMTSGSFETLYMLLSIVIVIALFHCYLEYRRQLIPSKLLGVYFIEAFKSMSLISSVKKDAKSIIEFSRMLGNQFNSLSLAVIDALFSPLFIIVLYFLHPVFALIILVVNLVLVGLVYSQQRALRKSRASHDAIKQQHFRTIDDLVLASKNLLADHRHKYWLNKHNGEEYADATDQLNHSENRYKSIFLGIKWSAQLAMPAVGAILLLNGEVTAGTLLAALIIGYRGLMPFESLLNQSQLLVKIFRLHAWWKKQLNELVQIKNKPIPLEKLSGRLSVDELTVAQPKTNRCLINNVNLQSESGQITAIIGPNGSGKSLLLDSIAGVGLNYQGHIQFDNYTRSNIESEWLGEQLAYIPQRLNIETCRIKELIAHHDDVDPRKVICMAKKVSVHDFILSLAEGYDTVIGSHGSTIPPGVMQRLLIAGALYKAPQYYLFDEADAYLDQEGQQLYRRIIESLKQEGATVILATQKRSIMNVADSVLILNAGETRYKGNVGGLNLSLMGG